jgi:hypothetical protein
MVTVSEVSRPPTQHGRGLRPKRSRMIVADPWRSGILRCISSLRSHRSTLHTNTYPAACARGMLRAVQLLPRYVTLATLWRALRQHVMPSSITANRSSPRCMHTPPREGRASKVPASISRCRSRSLKLRPQLQSLPLWVTGVVSNIGCIQI